MLVVVSLIMALNLQIVSLSMAQNVEAQEAEDTQTGNATIIDGDTVKIDGVSHRLAKIDAPERNQVCEKDGVEWLCGAEAAKHLRSIVRGRPVRCESEGEDQYGRRVSVCFVYDRELNSEMVASGYALAYRAYGEDYVGYEQHAREKKLGLWAGSFTEPWKYRRGEGSVATGDCRIKGNINAKGARLYHKPGDASYSQTVVTEQKGEKWFCTTEEAEAAGWSAAWSNKR
jgi:endonuclease YncB( thermonuclease family)